MDPETNPLRNPLSIVVRGIPDARLFFTTPEASSFSHHQADRFAADTHNAGCSSTDIGIFRL